MNTVCYAFILCEQVVESSEGAYRLRIIIEQQPEKEFIVPDCSLKCMKKSVIGHLQQYVSS